MPFTDMKFPVPEKRCITILIKVFLLQGNIDLRRKVSYKCKPRKNVTRVSLSAKSSASAVLMRDFQKFIQTYPDIPIVELDTVEGGWITVRRLS